MFPLVSGHHVDGYQHGVLIKISINLGKKYFCISCFKKMLQPKSWSTDEGLSNKTVAETS